MVHGCLHAGCIFVTPERQWKLFGFERTISNNKAQEHQIQVEISVNKRLKIVPGFNHFLLPYHEIETNFLFTLGSLVTIFIQIRST